MIFRYIIYQINFSLESGLGRYNREYHPKSHSYVQWSGGQNGRYSGDTLPPLPPDISILTKKDISWPTSLPSAGWSKWVGGWRSNLNRNRLRSVHYPT